ncbi:MAG TPA: hypothetical protein VGM94_00605 [Galbitalea sp.]|jgi:microcystin degradation protein MlrC
MSLQDNEVIFIPISDALYSKLLSYADAVDQAPEQVVEAALAGELTMPTRLERFRANILARTPRATPVEGVIVQEHGTVTKVFCSCCCGQCMQTFHWRGSMRCGCPTARGGIAAPIASGNS